MSGLLTALSFLAAFHAQEAAAEPYAGVEESCGLVVRNEDQIGFLNTPKLAVLAPTEPLALPPDSMGVQAVVCTRSAFVIGENDHRVLTRLGVPLNLDLGNVVLGIEISEGKLRARVLKGGLTEEQVGHVQAAIDRNQANLEAAALQDESDAP